MWLKGNGFSFLFSFSFGWFWGVIDFWILVFIFGIFRDNSDGFRVFLVVWGFFIEFSSRSCFFIFVLRGCVGFIRVGWYRSSKEREEKLFRYFRILSFSLDFVYGFGCVFE